MSEYTKYNATINVFPNELKIEYRLNIDYINKSEKTNKLEFIIYDDSDISIKNEDYMENVIIKETDKPMPFILGKKIIEITFKNYLDIGSHTSLEFQCSLDFKNLHKDSMNLFQTGYLELGIYTPWYPLLITFDEVIYDLNITLPNDYYLIGGQKINEDGTWSLTELEKPHCSIDFISAKTSEELFYEGSRNVNVHDLTGKKSETRAYLQSKVDDIMSLFISKFGNLKRVKLDIVLVPRKNSEFSGGYCRPNLIVVPGEENISNANNRYSNDEEQYLLEYLLHEIGHLWWSKADFLSFENWLNEAFAEYSKLIGLRELFGSEIYDKKIAALKEKSIVIGSIYDTSSDDEASFEIIRVKGPYILSELEASIGKDNMLDLMKSIHEKDIKTTEKVLDLVEEKFSKDIRDTLNNKLNS